MGILTTVKGVISKEDKRIIGEVYLKSLKVVTLLSTFYTLSKSNMHMGGVVL